MLAAAISRIRQWRHALWNREWRLLRRKRPAESLPDHEVVRFDEAGFGITSGLIRAMGWRERWSWDELIEFGFQFQQAMFPDPWIGDYMEAEWYLLVDEPEGPKRVSFEHAQLDVDRLPEALLRHCKGLDLDRLRRGLREAAGGLHHYEGEGSWVGWRRGDLVAASDDPA